MDSPSPAPVPQLPATPPVMPGQFRLPTTPTAWAALIIMAVAFAGLVYQKQMEQATAILGIMMYMLNMTGQQASAAMFAFHAAQNASVAAHAAVDNATVTQEKLDVVTEAITDIQNNPAQPGTPGWVSPRSSFDPPSRS